MFLESDPRTLFVGNLELNTTEEELRSKLLVTSGAWDIPEIVVCVGDEKTVKKVRYWRKIEENLANGMLDLY